MHTLNAFSMHIERKVCKIVCVCICVTSGIVERFYGFLETSISKGNLKLLQTIKALLLVTLPHWHDLSHKSAYGLVVR